MKNLTKMHAVRRIAGNLNQARGAKVPLLIIALLAVIGFSITACDNGTTTISDTGGLAAPVLTAEAISSTEINLYWTAIAGAAGYNLYGSLSSSSGFQLLGTRTTNSAGHSGITNPPGTTIYYRVAACSANGTEGAMSNTASATTLSAGGYSLNGVWEMNNNGKQVTVSGNAAVINSFGTPGTLEQDAINKGYVKLGDQDWRNLTSTGSLTWSGQVLAIDSKPSSPNVATGTGWTNAAFTMSNNGQTLSVAYTTGGSGSVTDTWTRSSYSLDGIWEDNGVARITVIGSSGVFSKLWDTPKPITQDAINKDYVKLGSQYWRNLTSTGNLTWSGQVLIVTYNTSSPNVATGTSWTNAAFTMSADAQTLTVDYTTGGSGAVTDTWTRK